MTFRPTPLDYVKQKATEVIWRGGDVPGDAYFEQNISVAGTATLNDLVVSGGANIAGGLTADEITSTGGITASGAIEGLTLESTATVGTPPLIVASPDYVANLNGQYLNSLESSAFLQHSLATAVNDFLIASGSGAFAKQTLAESLTTLGKAAASGLASLDASSLVVQNPANATATPTASKIPIADGSGKLNGWVDASAWEYHVPLLLETLAI